MSLKIILALTLSLSSAIASTELPKESLDLFGDGNKKEVKLQSPYLHHEKDMNYSLITQGGYKVFDIDPESKDVAVIGPCQPCLGFFVTDGSKGIAGHRHWTNDLNDLGKIIKNNLNTEDPSKLFAYIYTVTINDELYKKRIRKRLWRLSYRSRQKVKGLFVRHIEYQGSHTN